MAGPATFVTRRSRPAKGTAEAAMAEGKHGGARRRGSTAGRRGASRCGAVAEPRAGKETVRRRMGEGGEGYALSFCNRYQKIVRDSWV